MYTIRIRNSSGSYGGGGGQFSSKTLPRVGELIMTTAENATGDVEELLLESPLSDETGLMEVLEVIHTPMHKEVDAIITV